MNCLITTYSNAQNFGALLQAYALSSYINSIGCNCDLLNYRKFDSRVFKPRKHYKDIAYSTIKIFESFVRIKRYKSFRENFLPLTELFEDSSKIKVLNEKYDAFITGSDQVWNCSDEANPTFFLEFVNSDKKRISYAPSFGVPFIPDNLIDKVKHNLNKMNYISVREKSGAELIKRLISKDVNVVVDPVFLLDKDAWIDLASDIPINEPYVFVYSTQISSELYKAVKKFSRINKIKIISTHAIPGCKCIVKKDIGPLEFLGYILNADYVISTSFHATAFSIIFDKNFCVVPHSVTSSRVTDLLDDADLTQAIWNQNFSFSILNYKNAGLNALKERIDYSKKFLKDSLEV